MDIDGPALRVRAALRAETRYPLNRVSRVIANRRVEWSAGALCACLEDGVPIVIVSEDGAPLGSVHPAQSRVSPLAETLDELLDRPDWRDLYENWLRATRMRLLAVWRKSRRTNGEEADDTRFAELVRCHVYGTGSNAGVLEWASGCRAPLCALAATAIGRWGLPPAFWGSGGDSLDLLGDLSALLALRLRLEVGIGMEQALDDEAAALRVFHAMTGTLESEAERAIGSLARRAKQVLSEWR